MYEKRSIFSVPIFRLIYPHAKELCENLVPVLLEKEKTDTFPLDYSYNGYTNYGKENILDILECYDLKKFISNAVKNINFDIGISGDTYLRNSWFSINRKYSYHERHNHLPEVWSGVYYLKADENDAQLCFINKNLESNWPWNSLLYNNEHNSAITKCSVETGVMYIFPSYLEHAVHQQLNESERITIAFNYGIKERN